MGEWTGKEMDDLPDGSFAFVEEGGKKVDGKTVPRSKRHLPYKDADGKPDLPHVRNALARLDQCEAEGLDAAKKKDIRSHLESLLPKQARQALYEPDQKNFAPLRAGKYKKDVISVGSWLLKDGRRIEVTPERLDRWAAKFAEMKDAGILIDCPVDHSSDSVDNMGFVDALEREGNRLMSVLDIPRAKDQSRIGTTIREVSIELNPQFTDGNGRDWGEVISHVSPCTKPVVTGQENFVPLAARSGEGSGWSAVAPLAPIYFCRKAESSMALKEDICKLCGCADDASDADVLQAVKEKFGQHSTQMRRAKDERDQAVLRIQTLEAEALKLRAGGAGKDQVKEESPETIALRQDVERMIGEGAEAKLLQFRAEGKVTPAMEPAVRALLTRRRDKIQLRLADGETKDSDVASQVEGIFACLPKHAAIDLKDRTKLQLREVENPGIEKDADPAATLKAATAAAARVQGRKAG